MRTLALITGLFCVMPALAANDAVNACRTAHAGDPAAHIDCLEAALEKREASKPASLGAEQVAARKRIREEPAEPVTVQIASASYNALGIGTFRMEDGQVWRETEASPERRRLKPGTAYTAQIMPGRISGYRMHVEGVRWMKKVQRVE
jgi:hypothetical protein